MLKASNWLIVIGGCLFILMLAVSAFWEADIRWLHFFQAWMYVATIALALRRNRWGYFIGISAAGLWDYANLVATTFFFNGLEQLSLWVHSGYPERPDLLIAVPARFSNLFIVVGGVWGYLLLPEEIVRRLRQIRSDICAHHGILRAGHGHFPAALSGSLPPDVAPALALLRALSGADRLAISLIWQAKGVRFRYSGVSAPAQVAPSGGELRRGLHPDHHGEGFADPRRRTL